MTLDINSIEQLIHDHMSDQPYNCTCATCGRPVEFETKVDREKDIAVEVTPCSSCIEDAEAAAIAEGCD